MSTNELHNTIKELKEYKNLRDECDAKISELETILKSEMKTQNTDKLTVGEYKLTLSQISSKRVDSKALQENRPDIYALFVKASTYERLTVR